MKQTSKNASSTTTAAIYLRCSTLDQAENGVSLQTQEERCRAYCQMQGLEVVRVIRDQGISGTKALAARPGGEELLELVAAKKVAHVVCLRLDRAFRDAGDALTQTRAWEKAGVALDLVDLGGMALTTAGPMGRFLLCMLAGCAELERNLLAERTSQALAEKKRQGIHVGSPALGVRVVDGMLRENAEELVTLTRIRELHVSGLNLSEIVNTLRAEGARTKRGGAWHHQTVSRALGRMGVR